MNTGRIGSVAGLMLGVVACFGNGAAAQEEDREWALLAPFEAIEFVEEGWPRVRIDGVWREWVSIDGVGVDELTRFVVDAGEDVEKRVSEDLVEWMGRYGADVGPEVTLGVVGEDGRTAAFRVAMTEANRDAVRRWRSRPAVVEARVVFDEIVGLIEERHAYATLTGVDVRAVAEGIVAELEARGEAEDYDAVVLGVRRLVARLGDGHAGIRAWVRSAPAGVLPFRLIECEEGLAAVNLEGDGFIDDARPLVEAIDGLAIEEWLSEAGAYANVGSAAIERSDALRYGSMVNLVRDRLGREASGSVVVRLRSAEGGDAAEVALELMDWRTGWERNENAVEDLGDGIVKITIGSMALDENDLIWLDGALDRAAEASGVVIDVRANGGGSREATRRVLGRLVHRVDGGARVVNVARARVWKDSETKTAWGLENRYLRPAGWYGWTDAERGAIERFRAGFEAAWEPAGGWDGYGDWRYMVVSEPKGAKRIRGPVAVLLDGGCFSATDIFLGALKGVPGVTLVGTGSGGGSARTRRHELWSLRGPNGDAVEIGLASMASFMPNGETYDGNGITPDIVVERTLGCVVGRRDAQLERAVEVVRRALSNDSQ